MPQGKDLLRSLLQYCLKCAGKGEKKVVSVFGANAEASHRAVVHLRAGAPGVPIWLFSTVVPRPETIALCERVYRNPNALELIGEAQARLWECWVAISVGTWTGERGDWALKLVPFLIPPFHVLILNKEGDFFGASPKNVAIHGIRAGRDAAREGWGRLRGAMHDARVRGQEAMDHARIRGLKAMRIAGLRCQWALHSMHVRLRDFFRGLRDLFRGVMKLSNATGLRVLANLLRWTGNPHRKFFERLHGNQPLLVDTTPSAGGRVDRFVHSGPEWTGEALEKFALASDARWILWQEKGDADVLDEAEVLFDDERTFGVSQQTNFRGWKPNLAATAPFRALQCGEVSRVLAPLAGTILVDRQKLLALGIPRCSMPGTAWLILFWKAAAAGWRSYSIGQDASVPEQPEYPIQDAAFVSHVLRDPALRRLGPRQEDLSRGNIGFMPSLEPRARTHSQRLRVLVVSPFLPFPLSHGGAVRIYNLCRELSDRVDFTLIAMREANDVVDYAKLHEVFREVHVVDKDERTRHDGTLPAQVSASESSSLRALITQLSQKLMPDLIQFEYTHFAGFRDCAPGVPALLVEHDLTFSLYRQLAEANPTASARREYERWLKFERKWLGAYEGVWTVSEEDRARAMEEGERSGDCTFTIANGVDIDRFRVSDEVAAKPEVFYVGSFRHLPNIIGFERLYQEIMPRVWSKAPEARLRVVAGPEHERYWRAFGRKEDLRGLDSRIEVHGFVEDLRPLYARASVVVVPLEVSAGTNIKVLEAMACGKAIVTTPVGCAGLNLQDEFHVAMRQEWGEFSDAVCELLEDAELRSGLGARARGMVESSYSWKSIAERAYESYLTMTGLMPDDLPEGVKVDIHGFADAQK